MPVKALINSSEQPPRKVVQYVGTELGITIDNNAFSIILGDEENIVIENKNLRKLLFQITNVHATNGLIFEISGHASEADTPPAFADPPDEWDILPNGEGTIPAQDTCGFVLTDNWAWIAIRLRRETAGLNATADVYIRGE